MRRPDHARAGAATDAVGLTSELVLLAARELLRALEVVGHELNLPLEELVCRVHFLQEGEGGCCVGDGRGTRRASALAA